LDVKGQNCGRGEKLKNQRLSETVTGRCGSRELSVGVLGQEHLRTKGAIIRGGRKWIISGPRAKERKSFYERPGHAQEGPEGRGLRRRQRPWMKERNLSDIGLYRKNETIKT